ncbi:MAG: penicillin-binding protein, partial [Chloroflexi bacterium]|nr:penicillin-binding protein [Chloroflexota bacterium]
MGSEVRPAWRHTARPYHRLRRLDRQHSVVRWVARYGVSSTLIFGYLSLLGLLVAGMVGALTLIAAAEVLRAVPAPTDEIPRSAFQSSKIYARDGSSLLYEVIDPAGGSRTVVPLHDIPMDLLLATIATEDAAFFDHPGFDVKSILRAAYQNVVERRVVSGASTITQQLARHMLISARERQQLSYTRKVAEAVLAYRLTLALDKAEILELYLNEIYYGGMSYGVEAAAEGYFGKPANQLTLGESALLAGLPQSPALYDPRKNIAAARARQSYVLDRMVAQGFVDAREADQARAQPVKIVPHRFEMHSPHFVTFTWEHLRDLLGDESLGRDGLVITTSLDPHAQRLAEMLLREARAELREAGVSNGTLVALDVPTGEIIAIAGSLDYDDESISGQINQATVVRQPAGLLTPILLAAAFAQGRAPASVVADEPVEVPDGQWIWVARNADGAYQGSVSLRAAYTEGRFAPFAGLFRDFGGDEFAAFARNAGLRRLRRQFAYDPRLLLREGETPPLDVAAGYATLARGGVYRSPSPLRNVLTPDGESLVLEAPGRSGEEEPAPAMSAASAYLTTNVLMDSVSRGGVAGLRPSPRFRQPIAAAWTVSADDRDVWIAGYTPQMAVVLWLGNTNGERTRGERALRPAARLWLRFVEEALADVPPARFTRPSDVVEAEICVDPACTRRVSEVFIAGTDADFPRAGYALTATPSPTGAHTPGPAPP